MFSLTRRGAPKSDPTHHARRLTADILIHPRTGCQVMRSGLQGELGEEEEDDDDEEPSPSSGVSLDDSDLE